jgi:sec-independent protein translocase protein TatC
MADPPDDGTATSRAVTVVPPGEPEVAVGPGPGRGDEKVMTLVEHLSELRRRLALSILALLLGAGVGLYFAEPIIKLLLEPLPGGRVGFLTMTGGFMVYFRIALIVGALIALPVILYQLWAFVAPGLTKRERRAVLPWIPMTVVFFLLGTAVAYITLPYAISFLLGFQILGSVESLPSAEHYFGFVTSMFLIFGLVMQFPIVLIVLSKLGVLSVDRLRAARRYVLVGIVVFAVVVTPGGDPVSPIIMSSVMYLLYEGTILVLRRSSVPADG